MMMDEVNAFGGVAGRRIEVISRDGAGQPQDATRLPVPVGLALSGFAACNNTLYIAGRPLNDSGQGSSQDMTCAA